MTAPDIETDPEAFIARMQAQAREQSEAAQASIQQQIADADAANAARARELDEIDEAMWDLVERERERNQ